MRPARSISAPVASASALASGEACTPAAHSTVRAAMRCGPAVGGADVETEGVDAGDAGAHAQLDAEPLQLLGAPDRTACRRTWPAAPCRRRAAARGATSDRTCGSSARGCAWPARGSVRPARSPVGPGADHGDRQPLLLLGGVGRRLGHLEAPRAPVGGPRGRRRSSSCPARAAPARRGRSRTGRRRRPRSGCRRGSRPASSGGRAAWTMRRSRSKPVTSTSSTRTLRARRRTWRNGGAIWPGDRMPVATWYSSGWKRWWLRRSSSVTSTGRLAEEPAGRQPTEAPADDDDAVAGRAVGGGDPPAPPQRAADGPAHRPGLECMIPPSAKIVVAAR